MSGSRKAATKQDPQPPERLFIAGAPWRVEWVNQTRLMELIDDVDAVGGTVPQRLAIYIGDWTPDYVQKRTLIHEVLHACWSTMNDIAYGHDSPMPNEVVEEAVVSGLDNSLLTALRDNPEFVAWLMERDWIEAELDD